VIRRTADLWPKAPGCSLTTSARVIRESPGLVESVVRAFCRGAQYVRESPDDAADIASRYIAVHPRFIREALLKNYPDVDALRSSAAMSKILDLMLQLGYLKKRPSEYLDLSFLDRVTACAQTAP